MQRIEIGLGSIAYLLLRIARAAQTAIDSPLSFARLVRANLMHIKSIHRLGPEPPPPASAQIELALC